MKWIKRSPYYLQFGDTEWRICRIGPEENRTYELFYGTGAGRSKCLGFGYASAADAIAAHQAIGGVT